MISGLSLQVLGSFAAQVDGKSVRSFDSNKGRALLIYLAMERDKVNSRSILADLFWPNLSEQKARENLRSTLSKLRQTIKDSGSESAYFEITRDTLAIKMTDRLTVDAHQFVETLNHGNDQDDADLMAAALKLYGGAFLTGFTIRGGSEQFDNWLLLMREQFQQHYLGTLEWLTLYYTDQQNSEEACNYARQWVEQAPWSEDAHQQLIYLLAIQGKRVEALAHFEQCRLQLRDELGFEPNADLVALVEQIRQGKLADPSERSQPINVVPRDNLPVETTPLVGRIADLAYLKDLCLGSETRFINIVGPGGIGKSRLAVSLARTVQPHFSHGVFLVTLAEVQTESGIVPAIAKAVGLPLQAEQRNPLTQLIDFLATQQMLLLLDNLEHLTTMAELVQSILVRTSRLLILATSRQELRLNSETVFRIEGLSYPQDNLMPDDSFEAVDLFYETVKRKDPKFQLNEENRQDIGFLCRYVQGMPLGILLLASWANQFTLTEIVAELTNDDQPGLTFLETDLQDIPQRHRSIIRVCQQAWDQLSSTEQAVFQTLAIFQGDFSRQAAQKIASASLQILSQLTHKSWLRRFSNGRYAIHEWLRQFGQEQLSQQPEQAIATKQAHSYYYLTYLNEREPGFKNANQREITRELDVEWSNIQIAWRRQVALGDSDLLYATIEGLGFYYEWRSRYEEGLSDMALLLESRQNNHTSGEVLLQVAGQRWQTIFDQYLGNVAQIVDSFQQMLKQLEQIPTFETSVQFEKANILYHLGAYAFRNPQFTAYSSALNESLDLFRELGDQWYIARTLTQLAAHALHQGETSVMKERLDECFVIREAINDQKGLIETTGYLAFYFLQQTNYKEAERLMEMQAALSKQYSNTHNYASSLQSQGVLFIMMGKYVESEALIEKSIQLGESMMSLDYKVSRYINLAVVRSMLGKHSDVDELSRIIIDETPPSEREKTMGKLGLALGPGLLVKGHYNEACQVFETSMAFFTKSMPRDLLIRIRAMLGFANYKLGQPNVAKQQLRTALIETRTNGVLVGLLMALSFSALILADEGEKERAVDYYALASESPIVYNSPWFEQCIGKRIATIAASLPAAQATAAQERGRQRNLRQTVEVAIDWLGKGLPDMLGPQTQISNNETTDD